MSVCYNDVLIRS